MLSQDPSLKVRYAAAIARAESDAARASTWPIETGDDQETVTAAPTVSPAVRQRSVREASPDDVNSAIGYVGSWDDADTETSAFT